MPRGFIRAMNGPRKNIMKNNRLLPKYYCEYYRNVTEDTFIVITVTKEKILNKCGCLRLINDFMS